MKQSSLHKIFFLLTLLFLVLPVGLHLVHSLENYKHRICNSKELQHIHTLELECSIYHVKFRTESPDINSTVQLFIETDKNSTPLFLAKNRFYTPQKKVTTRGL